MTGIELARIGLTTDKGRTAQLLFMEGNAAPVQGNSDMRGSDGNRTGQDRVNG